jgi:hypothetical protein
VLCSRPKMVNAHQQHQNNTPKPQQDLQASIQVKLAHTWLLLISRGT